MVESADLKEIKKLSPVERIRQLKEFEKKKEEEMEQAKKLLAQSEIEIKDIMEEKRKIPIDQLKAAGMETLFTEEEKEVFKIKHFTHGKEGPTLEEMALTEGGEPVNKEEYRIKMSIQPIEDLYSQAKGLYSTGPGNVTQEQFYQALDLSYAVREKEEAIRSGRYTADEMLAREVDATKKIVHEIMNWYKG